MKRLTTEYKIITLFIIVNIVIHLVADSFAGFHGDELLYIEAGRHPAAGYMDFSPMIAYLAFVQNLFNSSSLYVNHLFLYIASSLILLLSGIITIEYGGKWMAVLVTMSCIMFSPGLGATFSLFLPDVFDQLTWILCAYFFIRFCKNGSYKYLLLLALSAAAGFMTKYTIVFFAAGLVLSVLIFNRELLKRRSLFVSIAIFLLIISPNIAWQIKNNFPVFNHFSELYETQLEKQSRMNELKTLFLYLNPLTAVFWLTGLFAFPFIRVYYRFRMVSFTLLLAFILFFIAKGKSYYYFPVILGVFPAGAVLIEDIFSSRKLMLVTYLSALSIFGAYLLPNGIPLMALDKYIRFYNLKVNEDGKIPIVFENFYSGPAWESILKIVSELYNNLSPDERDKCFIWGRHYSQAGGINLIGKKYGLPHAFSFHSSFYNWVPEFDKDIVVIAISEANLGESFWRQYFNEVTSFASVENKFTSDEKWYSQHIYLCRNPKYNSKELKLKFADEVF